VVDSKTAVVHLAELVSLDRSVIVVNLPRIELTEAEQRVVDDFRKFQDWLFGTRTQRLDKSDESDCYSNLWMGG
jgi:hypothetical protein